MTDMERRAALLEQVQALIPEELRLKTKPSAIDEYHPDPLWYTSKTDDGTPYSKIHYQWRDSDIMASVLTTGQIVDVKVYTTPYRFFGRPRPLWTMEGGYQERSRAGSKDDDADD